MPKRRSPSAIRWLSTTAAGLAGFAGPATLHAMARPDQVLVRPALLPEHAFRYDGILGTSMELIVQAPSSRVAGECERQVLAEIDRLAGILSTYDSSSEISRVMRGSPVVSKELADLLGLYEVWNGRTGGVISANLADVKRLWSLAQGDGQLPRESALREAFRLRRALNVDALGKGYIIDRAVEVARRITPAGLLNIGGDIRVWGDQAWPIGIANPFDHADNAAPLAVFPLRNAAVASSGGYARNFTIAGVRYSHIIDPRTLVPLSDICRSSTVAAPDCVTANALSTAMCVLDVPAADGAVDGYGLGHLTVQNGAIHRGGVLAGIPLQAAPAAPAPVSESFEPAPVNPPAAAPLVAWAKGYSVDITFTLKLPAGGKIKHPYVVVWIENERGRPIRNIALWGMQDRYIPHLATWFKLINSNMKGAKSFAVATRAAGKYTLTWDGKSDSGAIQTQGNYRVRIEICREHGTHAEQSGIIKCGTADATTDLKATAESDDGILEYKQSAR